MAFLVFSWVDTLSEAAGAVFTFALDLLIIRKTTEDISNSHPG